jgi:hypothetical protein
MFYHGIREIRRGITKHNRPIRRLTGMRAQAPSLIVATLRIAAMVALALLLIMGLLPVLAAQAAGGG